MAKKKVYAVRKGRETGLFHTWEACKRMVQGYPGAVYKSFLTEQEAAAYLGAGARTEGTGQEAVPSVGCQPGPGQVIAYVDGSYDKKIRRYSFGCILLTPDGNKIQESGNGNDPQSLALRNVTGEMLGAMHAVRWAQKNGYRAIDIRYDYAGIEQWATHGWQAKNELTQKYAAYMEKCSRQIQITYTKIAAHTGDKYNEEADKLAKAALGRE